MPSLASVLPLFCLFAALLPAQHGTSTVSPAENSAETAAPAAAPATPKQDKRKKKQPQRPGIPVKDALVQTFCGRCHQRDDRDHMTRISYVRKSPEGWSRSIKRMGRLHGLQLTADAAKQLVRSLSNSHGLARKEAERGLYDSERRVHWSEEHHDKDFQRACAQCHPLGRALLQHRSKEEWQLLRATHVAMFPLASRQMGGGPPSERSSRRGPPASSSAGNNDGRRSQTGSVGDRVLAKLTKEQPLFTPEWQAWTQHRREVPLAGTWSVTGHETGRGDVHGTLTMTRSEQDEYDLQWQLRWSDGSTATRQGKGILYAGYSWRGRSQGANPQDSWREVMLLDDSWQRFRGRVFRGSYDEIGMDVTLVRDTGRPQLVALGNAAIEVPTTGHRVDVHGEAFPRDVQANDFFTGTGLTITGAEWQSERHVVLLVDAAADAELGTRTIAYGAKPGELEVTLYDTVDYLRIRPLQGLARVGGAKHPRQLERFEAYAVHRGKDKKPYTEDDVDLFQVRPKWALREFHVRDDDDDLAYVGTIDATTGVFTPNVDGPNPKRKWQANNVGDVFVTCEVTLDVAVRPDPPKQPNEGKADGDKATEQAAAEEQPADEPVAGDAPQDSPGKSGATAPPARASRTYRARSHLIVTVPIYARWQVLDWEDR